MDDEAKIMSHNRLQDYYSTIQRYKKLPKEKQLIKVNLYLNQLLPQYDDIMQKQEDYWATPKEFLTYGYGDCEDYVIIKYFTLIELGFDKNKLFMTTVHETYTGGYHMVLSYFDKAKKSPLILDNLSFRVLDLKTREDLKSDLFINFTGIYKMGRNNKLIKTHKSSPKFQELLQRVSIN